MPRLEIYTADRKLRYDLFDAEFTVGGTPADDLRLPDRSVPQSTLHCWLGDAGEELEVEPRDGVSRWMAHGDRVQVGRCLLVFCVDGRPAPEVSPEEIPGAVPAAAPDGDDSEDHTIVPGRPGGAGLDLDITAIPAAGKPAAPRPREPRPSAQPEARRRSPQPPRRPVQDAPRESREPASKSPAPRRATSAAPAAPRAAAGRSRRTREPQEEEPRPSLRERRRPTSAKVAGMPRAVFLWNVMLLTLLVGYLLYSYAASQDSVREPEDMLALAHTQWSSGDHESAFATLRLAEERSSDASVRAQIAARRAEYRDAQRRLADQTAIDAGRKERIAIERFATAYLEDRPATRPAARELVRRCDDWVDRFELVLKGYPDAVQDVEAVQALRARHVSLADLSSPAVWDDIAFRVRRLENRTPRRYREALSVLGDFRVAASTGAEDRTRAEEEIARLQTEGKEWFAARRQELERRAEDSGRLGPVIAELRFLIETGVPIDWLGDAPQRLAELEARYAQSR